MIFHKILFSSRDWVFGAYFCRVTNFMTHMSIVAAVLTMSAIAVERYMTIARPRSPHLSIKATTSMLGTIWTVSIILATPTLLYSNTVLYSNDKNRTACLMVKIFAYIRLNHEDLQVWPDGDPSESLLDHCYQIIFFLVTYVLPMVGLSITYCHLGLVLWKKTQYEANQEQSNKQNKIKDKRKVGALSNF